MAHWDTSALWGQALARKCAKFRLHTHFVAQELGRLERLDMEEHLSGEGLMDLPQINVGIDKAIAGQHARNGKSRGHEQPLHLKVHRRDFPVDQFRTWNARRQLGETLGRCDPEARRDTAPWGGTPTRT